MADSHSIFDRLYYANRREYTSKSGNVAYLDGSPLRRPLTMSLPQRITAAVIVIVAIAIGAAFVNMTVLSSMREAAATEQAIADNLARPAAIESIPIMTEVIGLSDEKIESTFKKNGHSLIAATDGKDDDEMAFYRLPDDMNAGEATALYALGVSSLSVDQATRLLNGSWYFAADRAGATSMVVRYADFTTGDPQTAIQSAIEKQGLDPATISDSGVDESGNTYSMGVVEVDGKAYTWKISALLLSDMYGVSNLPEEACYVGIRLTAQ